ncbi:MAG TPA: flagellar hook-basal body complex protein FliE [Sedimenticola thiotaurini]|uniref:Flagellar hook-basal body complex protein FliE n=1 Tax=Sedimenticola thiotaurini TaxID=1543721 RepID=A0A831RKA9_9GAMM|nr:flagellar hook-basal body complex protein FliE [Sedimenticola thiotaurini]
MNNTTSIDAVLAQMRTLASQASGGIGVEKTQPAAGKVDFGQLLGNAIGSVNQTQVEASGMKQAFELGDKDVDLAEVMVAVQKSSISFEAMVQVRNKLVDAYKEVMNMPI